MGFMTFTASMNTFIIIASGILGIILGSALSVQVTRTRTGANLGKRSRCLSCGHVLSPRELVPIFSYLVQKGRCRWCKSEIPGLYITLELVTGFACAGIAAAMLVFVPGFWYGNPVFWLTMLCWIALTVTMIFLSAYDIRHLRLHTGWLYAFLGIGIVMALGGMWVGGQFVVIGTAALPLLLHRALAAGIALAFLIALWLISNGRWFGSGDVPVLVMSVLLFGFLPAFSVLAIAAWSAILWVFAQYVARGIMTRSFNHRIPRRLPFLPFLFLGMYLVGVWGMNLFGIMSGAL